MAIARIFHTDLLWKPGRPINAVLEANCDLSGMYSYSPASKFASVLPHQPSRLPRHNQYEISGLREIAYRSFLEARALAALEN